MRGMLNVSTLTLTAESLEIPILLSVYAIFFFSCRPHSRLPPGICLLLLAPRFHRPQGIIWVGGGGASGGQSSADEWQVGGQCHARFN